MTVESVASSPPVLVIEGLSVEFATIDGVVRAVTDVNLSVAAGEIVGIVGESGSGKSVTALSVLGLVPSPPGRIVNGRILFEGKDLVRLSQPEMRSIRGREIGMIFQDPLASLNPVLTIGRQIAEALFVHNPRVRQAEFRDKSIALLESVGVPGAAIRARQYPHEYSGGMRQRAMIAMALANRPKLLIADEPTTALDVTIQAQILDLLRQIQTETQCGVIFITHDFGVVAELCDKVMVMYAGRVVEQGTVAEIFRSPKHPYTIGLIENLLPIDGDLAPLRPIPGQPPTLIDPPSGCAFHPRCPLYRERAVCRQVIPPLTDVGEAHQSACHFHDEVSTVRRRAPNS